MSRARFDERRLLLAVLVVGLAFGCGRREEQRPATTPPPSPTPVASPNEAPDQPSSPGVATTSPPPAATAAPTAAAPGRPTAAATPPPKDAPTPPAALPQSAAPPTQPPAAATPTPQPPAGKPSATEPAVATRPSAQQPTGKITLPAKLGAVTFDHGTHAGKLKVACATCHHTSRPEKPLAAEQQACRHCHTTPATPPVKTSLQGAFHDPKAAKGTCIDCHKQSVAKGTAAPVKCLECHKKK